MFENAQSPAGSLLNPHVVECCLGIIQLRPDPKRRSLQFVHLDMLGAQILGFLRHLVMHVL